MEIYSLGSNGSGQLGIGNSEDASIPTRCKVAHNRNDICGWPVKVRAGGNHTLILLSTGQIYFCGTHEQHQNKAEALPFDPSNVVLNLVQFGNGSHLFKLCSTTWSASIVVTMDDRVFTWGLGNKGELGQGEAAFRAVNPSQLLNFTDVLLGGNTIADIASGVHHSVVVLSDGTVYGWGNGRKGQLGEPSGIIWEPRVINGLKFKASRAVCGHEFTFILGDPEEGRYAMLGTDKWNVKSDAPGGFPGWRDLGASWGSIFVLNHQNEIISWGRNDHGQLAPAQLPPIEQMAIGSEHGLVLTEDSRVLAWGWGEHGNCGSPTNKQGDVNPRWNEIWRSELGEHDSAMGIGAGCATSWIWSNPDASRDPKLLTEVSLN
ncbi:MAG: hypothetical protein MMC33_001959 [Icmadophila ericetorum]|nr:hypothetical protein [Icmadophila ericetorum]